MTAAPRTGTPRVRFAPSPTGYLHIGGVRTALFNWLWARKTGGTFVLRIEDTDRERSTPENEAIILRDMAWLGLTWDEGPDIGGSCGPYRQMERLELYRRFADELVDKGGAYRCYATKEELDRAREDLKARDPKAQFRYPGWWRDRSDWPEGKPYVIRLRVPESGQTGWNDLVFGAQSVPNSSIQDVVLVRSDGVPLYNFGCVVDDISMGITLIARGRDHMINTPIQILLYQAFGRQHPEFAHLPMMLGPGGDKLSKRHGAVSVGEYRDAGIVAPGLLNYLVRFGWGYGDQEIFSLDELCEKFAWERCNKADGKFDPQKLAAIAFEHLKTPALTSTDRYVELIEPFVRARYGEVPRSALVEGIALVRPRARTLIEAAESLDWLLAPALVFDDKARGKFLVLAAKPVLAGLRELLAAAPEFAAAPLEEAVKLWAEQQGLKLGAVAQPARVALTGKSASPGLFEVMVVLGRERALGRLDAAIALCEG